MRWRVGNTIDLAAIWIVEDSRDYRETVQEVINAQDDLDCPRAFHSGEDVLQHLNDHFAPELMLVDIGLPGISGIEVVKHLHGVAPETQTVMLTIHEDNDLIFGALCAGASGYLLKTATTDQILGAVREALAGGVPMTPQIARRVLNLFTQFAPGPRFEYGLTPREIEVLKEMITGTTKHQIAKELFIAESTVDTHMRHIYRKLHVHSRTEAVVKALKEHLV